MPLRLFDVHDTEAFCWHIVRSSDLKLTYHEAEDLCAFLVSSAWEISLRFEPGRGVQFSRYARTRLRNKTTDWLRKERGRTKWTFSGGRVYERKLPSFVSFDTDISEGDQLDATLGTRTGDPTSDRDPALARILDDGDRRKARDYELLGLEAPSRTP
jgi:DNA-directed RNA polymerase specialized sigma24 family protein